MSETLSQDPDNLGSGYSLASSYPPTPATPSSTVQDAPGSNLPPFSTFSSDMDAATGFGSDRLFTDTRLLDISSWDYYGETRLLDRTENGISVISSQPQYRPWESKPIDSTSQESLRHSFSSTTPISTFADAFAAQNGVPKLPSFQSQFQTFNEPTTVTTSEPTLTTLTNLTPVSPNSSSPSGGHLTTLNSSFHTLSAVNTRNYPLVPAPIQAREIPSIQQQFLDERHIQLFTHPTTSLTTLNNTIHSATIFPTQNGTILPNNQIITTPTVVTVLKSEPTHMSELKLGANLQVQDSDLKLQNVGLHHTQFQNPMSTVLDHHNGIYNGLDKKLNGINAAMDSPTRNDFRKKERRKIRASSLESSAESDGASSNMEVGSENSGQVASVSSTASFKTHHVLSGNGGMEADEISGGNADKQVKKKRKRCGECIGCQRKDNCGDCAPCRNDKSHQICKQRRCEKLTEKKLYGDDGYIRGDSRRGRGKGRGGGSYRGRKPSGPVSLPTSSVPEPSGPPPSRPSPQPVHMLKPEQAPQQQPMTPMPFYADPNRFTTPVWQADPTQGWTTQGQFIQQIPAAAQPPLEGYTQQYPNGIYQTTYQQPTGFEANTFYTGAVQVLTRPPSAPNQPQLPNRANGSYSHTPSPVPGQTQQNNQRTNISGQYQQEYATNNQNYAAPSTTPTGNIVDSSQSGGMSRPNSVNSTVNAPSSNQNFPTQHTVNFTPISSSNFSPVSNSTTNFVNSNINTNSGNAMPGYPPVSSHPPLASHNYSGGYPGNQMSGQNSSMESPHNENNQHWSTNSNDSMWEQNVIQACNNESAKSDQNEMQYTQNGMSHQNEDMQYSNHQNDKSNHQQQISHNQMQNGTENQFSQADRINLNSRLKTMILNKQQQQMENKMDEAQKIEQNQTGHFLWYSHHRRHSNIDDGGGVPIHHLPRPSSTPQNHHSQAFKNSAIDYQRNQNKQGLITNNNKFVSANNNNNNNNNNVSHSKSEKILESIEEGKRMQYRYLNSSVPSYQQLSDQDFVRSIIQQQKSIQQQEDSLKKSPKLKNPNFVKNPIKQDSSVSTSESIPKQSHNNNIVGAEIPQCNCLPSHQFSPEPGSYYTHLGCASNLPNLRKDLETRTGVIGKAIRVEKVCYTGKEGKTPQGCPIAKWIIRRANYEEKYLIVVKHRPGHFCEAAVIVICIVAWDGLLQGDADNIYSMLCSKLNNFGLPTNRRCATNESRTCACQGLDPDNCGASFSFGCSWSMYYNGCKFARSKFVRKFRLSEKSEEEEVEERMQALATHLTPLYKALAPDSFRNQCEFEDVAADCRLGMQVGRPFSGVTACLDFCAHAHKDSHNMNNGCTVVVTLTKHRGLSKPDDEQLHVLPLYVIDKSDEFGSVQDQENKIVDGSVEVLHKYQCEVRVRDVPQPSCRRAGKKKKDESQEKCKKDKKDKDSPSSKSPQMKTPVKQLQSNHVSSTVIEHSGPSPPHGYVNNLYYNPSLDYQRSNIVGQASFNHTVENSVNAKYQNISSAVNNSKVIENYASNKMFKDNVNNSVLLQEQPNSALHSTYPYNHANTLQQNYVKSNVLQFNQNTATTARNFNHLSPFAAKATNNINCDRYSSDYQISNNNFFNNNAQSLPLLSNQNRAFPSPSKVSLPPFTQFRSSNIQLSLPFDSREINSPSVLIQNPFDDSLLFSPNSIRQPDFDYDNYYANWNSSPSNYYVPVTPPHPNWCQTSPTWSPVEEKPKVLGQVTDVIDNDECFTDSQVGGVAIALSHGSVLFECAKHELHATTALKYPNRKSPTRISLVFYQHRNLNNSKHGWEEHEEKMRLKKLDLLMAKDGDGVKMEFKDDQLPVSLSDDELAARRMMNRVPTMTTASVTTKFPMYPCMVTGPYQEGIKCA